MYVPFVTPWLSNSRTQTIERRKGGGGKGGGGSGKSGGSSSGSQSSSKSSSSSGSKGSSGSSGSVGKGSSSGGVSTKTATGQSGTLRPGGGGSKVITTIPAGQPFAGRSAGGGTRADIYGSRSYGSGYPGLSTATVISRGFPFYFWPLTFGATTGFAVAHGLHSNEYGDPGNSTRPGGAQFEAPIQPPDGSNTTYRIMADNTTVQSLISSIQSSCSPANTPTAIPFNNSSTAPRPEQAIQFYRASSIVLTLDGYNNTAVFSDNNNITDTPLPSGLNQTFLNCLNMTIGTQAPLFDGAIHSVQVSGFLALSLVVLHLCKWIL